MCFIVNKLVQGLTVGHVVHDGVELMPDPYEYTTRSRPCTSDAVWHEWQRSTHVMGHD